MHATREFQWSQKHRRLWFLVRPALHWPVLSYITEWQLQTECTVEFSKNMWSVNLFLKANFLNKISVKPEFCFHTCIGLTALTLWRLHRRLRRLECVAFFYAWRGERPRQNGTRGIPAWGPSGARTQNVRTLLSSSNGSSSRGWTVLIHLCMAEEVAVVTIHVVLRCGRWWLL